MSKQSTLEIFGIKFSKVSYEEILDAIESTILNKKQTTICYANVNSINLSINDETIIQLLSEFNIVHPDGFGVFLSSKFLFGKDGFSFRQSGSDLYERIIEKSILNNWKLFIFGDTDETLERIKYKYPGLSIVGKQNGYVFENEQLLSEINNTKPDILIVGLGTPKQEDWIVKNKSDLIVNVIAAVGDGIKVFAGTKKRGPKFIQMIGLEWFVRFLYEPKRLWKRYFIGLPLFIFRIVKFKFQINKTDL
ncbi:MAG TPA: WecB/TagA/CpsF family glycosyltransferase [Ignavibacteriaceae bacterium]|nr:MAG: LPS biosynthesis protein [Ignavibacteriota bacterium]HMN17111.1 WecB/TagA/CpsF family glycosyltransferase [Ignavibacteriaceae bacterium]